MTVRTEEEQADIASAMAALDIPSQPLPQTMTVASSIGEEVEPASSTLDVVEVPVPKASPASAGEVARVEVAPRLSDAAETSLAGMS